MIHKVFRVVITIAILAIGFLVFNKLANSKKPPKKQRGLSSTTVFTESVVNDTLTAVVTATGQLQAENKVELFSEVQGVMRSTGKRFKEGTEYRQGELIIRAESDVFEASLKAQKSSLQNLITSALADIKLDFPESFNDWESYVLEFGVDAAIAPLPEPRSDREKLFMSGRNIYPTYYNVKNQELTLNKYRLTAPFSGILSEATVDEGTLIRPGQKLGTLIDPGSFELAAPVNASLVEFLDVGQSVSLRSTSSGDANWQGEIIRINPVINPGTQSATVFVRVKGDGLEEGMYLEADIQAQDVPNAFEIDRSVIFNNNQAYIAVDTTMMQRTITPVFFKESTAIVQGLRDGDRVLTKLPPGAYPGMRITIYSESQDK